MRQVSMLILRSQSPARGIASVLQRCHDSGFRLWRHPGNRIPARAETLVRMIDMPLHRKPRGAGIVVDDRLDHRAMLGHGSDPQLRRGIVMVEALVQRSGTIL